MNDLRCLQMNAAIKGLCIMGVSALAECRGFIYKLNETEGPLNFSSWNYYRNKKNE